MSEANDSPVDPAIGGRHAVAEADRLIQEWIAAAARVGFDRHQAVTLIMAQSRIAPLVKAAADAMVGEARFRAAARFMLQVMAESMEAGWAVEDSVGRGGIREGVRQSEERLKGGKS